jgi:hypothetical protein
LLASGYTGGDIAHALKHYALAVMSGEVAGTRHMLVLLGIHSTVTEANALVGERQGRYTDDQINAFRHLFGACRLARSFGPDEAREATAAHERRLRSQSADQAQDSAADSSNNAKGIRMGTDPANAGQSCGKLADDAIAADQGANQ